jgi:hypothetical protein
MATSANAQIGKGSTLSFWDTINSSPAAWQTLGKVRNFSGIGVTNPEVNSTTLDSTSEDYIAGMPNGKEFQAVLTLTAASLAILETLVNAGAVVDFRVVRPAPMSTSRYFSVTSLDYDEGTTAPGGLLEVTFKGRITNGAPTSVASHT